MSKRTKNKKCLICGEEMNQYNLFNHIKKEHGLTTEQYKMQYEGFIHKCDECGKLFKTEKSLIRHKQFKHGMESEASKRSERQAKNRNIKCEICGKTFSRLNWLARHVRECHQEEISVEDYYKTYINTDTSIGFCKHCGKETKFKGFEKGFNDFCNFSCSTKWYAENTNRIEMAWETIREKQKNDPNFRLSNAQPQYWINKGFSEEEAIKKVSERQSTFSKKICIEKYGKEEGLKRWKERQKKWQDTLLSKSDEELERMNKAKMSNGRGYSKISQKLFWNIFNNVKNIVNKVYFAENLENGNNFFDNGEFFVNLDGKLYLYDFYIPEIELVVEFDGDYWHGERRGNLKRDKKREDDILNNNPNLEIIRVLEREYNKNADIIVEQICNRIREKTKDLCYGTTG